MRPLLVTGGALLSIVCFLYANPYRMTEERKSSTSSENLSASSSERSDRELNEAMQWVEQGDTSSALRMIKDHRKEMEQPSPLGRRWRSLFADLCEQEGDLDQLVILYEYDPDVFKARERSSLQIAGRYLTEGRWEEYHKLRNCWSGRGECEGAWFLLDFDALLATAPKFEEAEQFLLGRSLSGVAEGERLMRLALLHGVADPKRAWTYLEKAVEADPNNGKLYVYRAKLLQAAGSYSKAVEEYEKAITLVPRKESTYELLGDLQRERGVYKQALRAWSEGWKFSPKGILWANSRGRNLEVEERGETFGETPLETKLCFWSRVAIPSPLPWYNGDEPTRSVEPFLTEDLQRVWNKSNSPEAMQAVYWLQLLDTLRSGDEREALRAIEVSSWQNSSWSPRLEQTLLCLLRHRQQMGDSLEGVMSEFTKEEPEKIDAFMKGPYAFSALFLAAHWWEAAIQLRPTIGSDPRQSESLPDGYLLAMTEAFYETRGVADALIFLAHQPPRPRLELKMAELFFSQGDFSAAHEQLHTLVGRRDAIGIQASLLESKLFVEQNRYGEAKKVIDDHPLLKRDRLGYEALARIALLRKEKEEAETYYKALLDTSPEATSFLARRALERGDLHHSYELTQRLFVRYPADPTVKKNLDRLRERVLSEELEVGSREPG